MNRHEVIRRGESAQHLLGNPVAVSALDEVQQDCFEAWANSSPNDHESREFAYKLFLAVKLLRGKLNSWSDDAKVEISNAEARKREAHIMN